MANTKNKTKRKRKKGKGKGKKVAITTDGNDAIGISLRVTQLPETIAVVASCSGGSPCVWASCTLPGVDRIAAKHSYTRAEFTSA